MAWFEKAKEWMTPERAAAFQGIGMGLSQLDAGRPVDLSPAYAALEQRKQQTAMRKMLEVPGIMDSFTPQQQAVLASMPEGLATQIIMEHAFKAQEPVAGVNVGGNLVNPYTGEVMYAAPGEAPKPIEVGGVLLDPTTMQPIFDSRVPDTPATPMTPEQRAYWGIPATDKNAYKMTENGPVAIGGNGTSVTVDLGGGPELGKLSTDYGYVLDEKGNPKIDPATGLPMAAPVPGSPAAIEAERLKAAAANAGGIADTTSDTIITAATRANDANNERLVGGVLGALASYNPSTPNAEVYRQTESLKSIASIENITAMRKASPTGAALGAASDKDIELLKNKHGALDPASPNYERDLMDYTRALLRTVHGDAAGDAIFTQNFGQAASQDSGADADGWTTLPNGVKVRVKP